MLTLHFVWSTCGVWAPISAYSAPGSTPLCSECCTVGASHLHSAWSCLLHSRIYLQARGWTGRKYHSSCLRCVQTGIRTFHLPATVECAQAWCHQWCEVAFQFKWYSGSFRVIGALHSLVLGKLMEPIIATGSNYTSGCNIEITLRLNASHRD